MSLPFPIRDKTAATSGKDTHHDVSDIPRAIQSRNSSTALSSSSHTCFDSALSMCLPLAPLIITPGRKTEILRRRPEYLTPWLMPKDLSIRLPYNLIATVTQFQAAATAAALARDLMEELGVKAHHMQTEKPFRAPGLRAIGNLDVVDEAPGPESGADNPRNDSLVQRSAIDADFVSKNPRADLEQAVALVDKVWDALLGKATADPRAMMLRRASEEFGDWWAGKKGDARVLLKDGAWGV